MGAPTPYFDPKEYQQFCPRGYYHAEHSLDFVHEEHSYETKTAVHKTCIKCPRYTTSSGGTSPSCHPITQQWHTCTHVACRVTTDKHCAKTTHQGSLASGTFP